MAPLTLSVMASILFGFSVVVWALQELALGLRDIGHGDPSKDRGSKWLLITLVLIALLWGTLAQRFLTDFALPPGRGKLEIAGVALLWLGMAVRLWSVATLGRFFRLVVMVQEDHRVVDAGPYARIRHPSYAGVLLSLLGIGVGLANWISILCLVVLPLIGIARRIRLEERVLRSGLGQAYEEYRERTWALIPGFW